MELVGAERYQSDKLEHLEKYVDEQLTSHTYNLDTNLALLRFYQFQPQSVKPVVLAKVLLKALMQLPAHDYKICVHLVPERVQAEEPVARVIALANALETTKFADFWSLTTHGQTRDLLSQVPGFYGAVRQFIMHVMGITFQRVPKLLLAENLRLEGAALDEYIGQRVYSGQWSTTSSPKGELIVLPKNDNNQMVLQRPQEAIRFEQVAPMLRAIDVAF